MKKKTAISAALGLAMGLGLAGQALAATLTAGSYTMTIRETPEYIAGTNLPDVGCVGSVCSNSSFTFGGFPSLTGSQRMVDSGATVGGAGGIGGDGVAGVIDFDVDAAGNFSITSFSVDTIAGTAAGSFAQYTLDPSTMSGSIDAAGSIIFTPTDRIANTSGPVITANPFNFSDATNTTWQPFTTAAQTGLAGDVVGQALDDAGHAVLVSATAVGSNWGTFAGGTYYEVWSVDITPSAIPVPAAVWLFGSGLLGLVGVARRKKA
ncbi:VPLPA-CTERM sorting domain-containing protein [Crocinitomicaceae bacterium]|nr:VPLPA-CTERM sorting domain-containing protein [Crocinitomicaceae bacterium]